MAGDDAAPGAAPHGRQATFGPQVLSESARARAGRARVLARLRNSRAMRAEAAARRCRRSSRTPARPALSSGSGCEGSAPVSAAGPPGQGTEKRRARDTARSRLRGSQRSREISRDLARSMSCDPRSHGILGHMRSRLLASKRAPRVVGRPTPRGARVRVDVRVTACACERARARARPRVCSARVRARRSRGAENLTIFFLAGMKTLRFLLRGLVWNVDDRQREAPNMHKEAHSETV